MNAPAATGSTSKTTRGTRARQAHQSADESTKPVTYREALRAALREALIKDERVFIITGARYLEAITRLLQKPEEL